MTDIVYVLGTGSNWDNNELRFSLRSLETYISGIGTVYLVGECPRWITNVVHLPFPDLHTCKEKNIMLKMAYACGHPDLSETFLHVHDDHFALDYMDAANIPYWAGGQLDRLAKAIDKRNHWGDAVRNTYEALVSRGFSTHNFDLHYPMLFKKSIYPKTMDLYDWTVERGYVVKSLYANSLGINPTRFGDLKLNGRMSMQDIVTRLKGRPWYSLGNAALSLAFRNFQPLLYPNPSSYEII